MITPAWKIVAFNLGAAAALVGVTGVIGYIAVWAFGFLWNRDAGTGGGA